MLLPFSSVEGRRIFKEALEQVCYWEMDLSVDNQLGLMDVVMGCLRVVWSHISRYPSSSRHKMIRLSVSFAPVVLLPWSVFDRSCMSAPLQVA